MPPDLTTERERPLTVEQAADWLQVEKSLISEAVAGRFLNYIRLGKHIRIYPSSLDDWCRANTVKGQPPQGIKNKSPESLEAEVRI